MRLFRSFLRCCAASLLFTPGVATAATVYFHKPAVTRDAFIGDSIECEGLARGINTPTIQQPYTPNLYAAGAGALLAGIMQSRDRRAMVESVLRTCMADKGYRRVKASPAVRKSLGSLSGEAKVDRLAALAGADRQDGEILPL